MEKVLNGRIADFSKTIDVVQTILIYLIALLVPTFLGEWIKLTFGASSVISSNSQFVIGSVVNCALVMTALNLNGWAKVAGVITMPSISAILSGYVFHTASPYMVWMIPAIWIGNFALVYAYKFVMLLKGKKYFMASIVGIITKVVVIACGFMLLKTFGVFPEKLISTLQIAMTSTQFITATIGASLAFAIYSLEKNALKSKK